MNYLKKVLFLVSAPLCSFCFFSSSVYADPGWYVGELLFTVYNNTTNSYNISWNCTQPATVEYQHAPTVTVNSQITVREANCDLDGDTTIKNIPRSVNLKAASLGNTTHATLYIPIASHHITEGASRGTNSKVHQTTGYIAITSPQHSGEICVLTVGTWLDHSLSAAKTAFVNFVTPNISGCPQFKNFPIMYPIKLIDIDAKPGDASNPYHFGWNRTQVVTSIVLGY